MVDQYIWIGIVVGVFFLGLAAGFSFLSNTDNPNIMKFQNQQLFDQMMSQNPKMTAQWMETMMQDVQFHDQLMDYMEKNPEQMNQWMIHDPKHIEEMSTAMSENHDLMMEMMMVMMEDPNLRLQMIGHMTENPESMEQMKNMIGQSMMDPNMMENSMSDMQFNVDAPITMPMIDGYYNGEKVFFVHTEVSDKDMADMMSMMINFPTLHVSELNDISQEELAKIYVFTNGISGSEPYGGGPFMFQIDVFDSVPDQMGYRQFRIPHLVTWNDNSTPTILTSVDEILEAESNGELTIQKTDNVVNAPMMVWMSDGKQHRANIVPRMFHSMPDVTGEAINVDVDNYMSMFKLHSQSSMGMMDMTSIPMEEQSLYNEDLNPSQVEYPNIVGFNDLHIEAIRHLQPNGDDSKLDVLVHHHCKVYDDMTAACLLFPTGMEDQDKPYGMEYIISSEEYAELSDEEKQYWHYHLTELPRAKAIFPDLTPDELAPLQTILDETYGKVFYFWDSDKKYPIGEPSVLVIQDLPE